MGVPQESILGHLVHLYADDAAISVTVDSNDELQRAMEGQLRSAMAWMIVNLNKTKCMTFGMRTTINKLGCLDLRIEDSQIEHVQKFKYLGMILDPVLSFKDHVSYIRSKVGSK